MIPFTVKFKRKLYISKENSDAFLTRTKQLLLNSTDCDIDLVKKTILLNSNFEPKWVKKSYVIGFLNSAEFTLKQENDSMFLYMNVSFIPLFGISFILFPFILTSLLPIENNPFETKNLLYFWCAKLGFLIAWSLIEYHTLVNCISKVKV
ncbi:hypothetical protein LEP1GSC195_1451 [Leptospira wolbachii serovar Codice str. CDC]|uniref:Uncharacterized protein n=1 Tax=Leptospira wolbachii serovar Codice str. CDC TaxID=1218599 RepID=R9A6W9_9LEPT|nr:hypothetical protein [Leptospira wolbachii]EOQ97842.1 hypothetical protein LEP1GSC195_1451 [Leptospira wolbachii serovar Codice str. CDC]